METKAVENKKVSLRECIAEAKAKAEAQAKEAEASAREQAEGSIQTAFWAGKIDLEDAEILADYIDTLTPNVLVSIGADVAQMLLHYRASQELVKTQAHLHFRSGSRDRSRAGDCAASVSAFPGRWTVRELAGELDRHYDHTALGWRTDGRRCIDGMVGQRQLIGVPGPDNDRDNARLFPVVRAKSLPETIGKGGWTLPQTAEKVQALLN